MYSGMVSFSSSPLSFNDQRKNSLRCSSSLIVYFGGLVPRGPNQFVRARASAALRHSARSSGVPQYPTPPGAHDMSPLMRLSTAATRMTHRPPRLTPNAPSLLPSISGRFCNSSSADCHATTDSGACANEVWPVPGASTTSAAMPSFIAPSAYFSRSSLYMSPPHITRMAGTLFDAEAPLGTRRKPTASLPSRATFITSCEPSRNSVARRKQSRYLLYDSSLILLIVGGQIGDPE